MHLVHFLVCSISFFFSLNYRLLLLDVVNTSKKLRSLSIHTAFYMFLKVGNAMENRPVSNSVTDLMSLHRAEVDVYQAAVK